MGQNHWETTMIRPFAVLGLFALTACTASEPLPYISPAAMAALPEGTDLQTVWRRDDGCYFIQTEDELSGYLIRVKDAGGSQVCDDI